MGAVTPWLKVVKLLDQAMCPRKQKKLSEKVLKMVFQSFLLRPPHLEPKDQTRKPHHRKTVWIA